MSALSVSLADRQRRLIVGRVRGVEELEVDWKVSRPGTRVVALVGCGKAKGSKAAPARELYTSPLFRKSLELAELIADATFVASASRGLVELDEIVEPYDTKLPADRHAADAWARDLLVELVLHALGSAPILRLVLFMGTRYAAPIIRVVEEARRTSTSWETPTEIMRGLEIGDRLAFLNRAIPVAKLRRGAK